MRLVLLGNGSCKWKKKSKCIKLLMLKQLIRFYKIKPKPIKPYMSFEWQWANVFYFIFLRFPFHSKNFMRNILIMFRAKDLFNETIFWKYFKLEKRDRAILTVLIICPWKLASYREIRISGADNSYIKAYFLSFYPEFVPTVICYINKSCFVFFKKSTCQF